MKIGIIGAGNIGATVAQIFINAGHEIAIANSRGPETLQDLVARLGERARAETIEDAAKFGEVVFISIPSDLATALSANQAAWQNFDVFSEAVKRVILA